MTHDHITRRSFLATFVAGGAALALASCFDSNTGTSTSSSDEGDSGAEAKEILTKPLDNGYDTGPFKTVITRGWMSEIGIKKHYVDKDGPFAIKL